MCGRRIPRKSCLLNCRHGPKKQRRGRLFNSFFTLNYSEEIMTTTPTPTPAVETKLPIASMGGSIAQAFSTGESFALAYRMAQALAASDMVPQQFKGNPSNCVVALDMANRI